MMRHPGSDTKAVIETLKSLLNRVRKGDHMVGDDIAEDGIRFLQSVNFGGRSDALAQIKIAAE